MASLIYKGNLKHKDWRPDGGYGTICPRWTHDTDAHGFAGDCNAHDWGVTEAQRLLSESCTLDGQRYAAANGIAFCAYPTGDGTWHGHPIPWKAVPQQAQDWLLKHQKATRKDIRRQLRNKPQGTRWALTTYD